MQTWRCCAIYVDFVIVNNKAKPHLGLDTCLKLNLIKRINEVCTITDKNKCKQCCNNEVLKKVGNYRKRWNSTFGKTT